MNTGEWMIAHKIDKFILDNSVMFYEELPKTGYITIDEVCNVLHYGRGKVNHFIKLGYLETVKEGRKTLITVESVKKLFEKIYR